MAIKCALIGYGYWGKIIEKYIRADKAFDLQYIYSPSLSKDINIDELCSNHNIQSVFICTPIDTHYEIVKKFLENGKHVFCEKPLCKKSEHVQELYNIAHDRKLCLYTDYIYTVSPSIVQMRKEIPNIGKVCGARAIIEQFGNFYKTDDVYDVLGVHMLSALLYALSALGQHFVLEHKVIYRQHNNLPLDSSIGLKINGNINVMLECSLIAAKKKRIIEIIGEHGTISFNMMEQPNLIVQIDSSTINGRVVSKRKEISFDEGNNLHFALETFKEIINGNIQLKEENELLSKQVTGVLELVHGNNSF